MGAPLNPPPHTQTRAEQVQFVLRTITFASKKLSATVQPLLLSRTSLYVHVLVPFRRNIFSLVHEVGKETPQVNVTQFERIEGVRQKDLTF